MTGILKGTVLIAAAMLALIAGAVSIGRGVSADGDKDTYSLSVGWYDLNPADATTYYGGYWPRAPVTASIGRCIPIPVSGTITVADIWTYAAGTVGTNEDISIYIRVNDAADTLVATVGLAARTRRFTNTGMSLSVSAGDFIELKIVCPNWATNPTTWIASGVIYVDVSQATVSPTVSPEMSPTLSPTPTLSMTVSPTVSVTPMPTATPVTTGTPYPCFRYNQSAMLVGSTDGVMTDYQMHLRVFKDLVHTPYKYNETVSEITAYGVIDGYLFWSLLGASGISANFYQTELNTSNTTILNVSFAQWQGVVDSGVLWTVGECKDGVGSQRVTLSRTIPGSSLSALHLNTDDCNELIGIDDNSSHIVAGERHRGGVTTNSTWPNGGGLWLIPKATWNNTATWERVYEDSKGYMWMSIVRQGAIWYALQCNVSNQEWRVNSSTTLTDWITELDYTSETGTNCEPIMIKVGNGLAVLAPDNNYLHMFTYNGSWTDFNLSMPLSAVEPTFIKGYWDSDRGKVMFSVGLYTSQTHSMYEINLDGTELVSTISGEPGLWMHTSPRYYEFMLERMVIVPLSYVLGGTSCLNKYGYFSYGNIISTYGHCNDDFGDLRFRDVNNSDYDYWLEDYNSSVDADFWIEVDNIPASPNVTMLYAYYGNASAVTTSNGEETFIFFDNFSSDMSDWDVYSGTWAVVGGQLVNTDNLPNSAVFTSTLQPVPSSGYRLAMKATTDRASAIYLSQVNNSIYSNPYYLCNFRPQASRVFAVYWNGAAATTVTSFRMLAIPSMMSRGSSGDMRLYSDNVFLSEANNVNLVDTGGNLYLALVSGWYGLTPTFNTFDDVWLGKYTANETFFYTWSDEVLSPCPGCPFDLTATSSGGNEAYLTWQSTPYATAYMVRMRTDHYPTSVTDGQLVYYGINNSCTVTGLALDPSTYYFRVWTEDLGWYSDCYSDSTVGGVAMLFGIIGGITLMITWFSSRRPEILLRLVASIMWLALMFWIVLGSTGFVLSDVWTGLIATACGVMAFVPWYWQMQTAIIRTRGDRSWTEYGEPPSIASSRRTAHARQLNRITRGRRARRAGRWQF